MLIQSHDDCIELLPAIPDSWKDGSFSGLKARGGVVVDVEWAKGKVVEVVLKSSINQTIKLKIGQEVKQISLLANENKVLKF
jgi:alpha-L-fucosidase 2